jgi:hypothetical protein
MTNNQVIDNAKAIKFLINSIGYDGFAALIELHAEQNEPCAGEFILSLNPFAWSRFDSLQALRDSVDEHLETKDLSDQEFIAEFKKLTNNGLIFLGEEVIAFDDL